MNVEVQGSQRFKIAKALSHSPGADHRFGVLHDRNRIG
jgi:hypothetical protein